MAKNIEGLTLWKANNRHKKHEKNDTNNEKKEKPTQFIKILIFSYLIIIKMEIENTQNLKNIINNQNKTIEFLYKEQSNHVEQINEKQEQLDTIFNLIAELYDYIENRNYGEYVDSDFVLEELAKIQNYCK